MDKPEFFKEDDGNAAKDAESGDYGEGTGMKIKTKKRKYKGVAETLTKIVNYSEQTYHKKPEIVEAFNSEYTALMDGEARSLTFGFDPPFNDSMMHPNEKLVTYGGWIELPAGDNTLETYCIEASKLAVVAVHDLKDKDVSHIQIIAKEIPGPLEPLYTVGWKTYVWEAK